MSYRSNPSASAASAQTDFSSAKGTPEQSRPFSDQASFDAFVESLDEKDYTHVPVVHETLADLDTPVSTYLKLANQPRSYLFESVQGGNKWGRYSIIGLPCNTVYQFQGHRLQILEQDEQIEQREVDNPLDEVRRLQAQFKVAAYPGLPEMIGGLVGYFGYETVGFIEPKLAGGELPDPLGTPDIMLMVSTDVLVFDNLSGRIFLVTLAALDDPQAWERAQTRLTEIETQLRSRVPEMHRPDECDTSPADYHGHFEKEQFAAAVERCRDYIREGDIMQVVLSQRLSIDFAGRPFDLYRALRTINPSPYMYFLNMGGFEIVGSSPEILVRLEDRKVTVRPIAGTRKRGATPAQDLALEEELLADEKELAEHVMLIDLGRNDVGRIASVGSVELTERMVVERYSHVMHIVSNVDGVLADGHDAMDVLRATFPAGTVSGAPKIRAMQIIAELEPLKRGVYSGAVGYLGWNGNMDTAIAIRTAVIKDGQLNIQAGAGIVADSVPEYEWKETLSKARVMFKAVEMATRGLGVNN